MGVSPLAVAGLVMGTVLTLAGFAIGSSTISLGVRRLGLPLLLGGFAILLVALAIEVWKFNSMPMMF
jgi:hypothetical protein